MKAKVDLLQKSGIFSSILLPLILLALSTSAQVSFSRQDSLRGSLNEERTGWDVRYYRLAITPDFTRQTITGQHTIRFSVVHSFSRMQIDLQQPLELLKASWHGQPLSFQREGNAYHLKFPQSLQQGVTDSITLDFSGRPVVAKRPPWDGGWIFTRDSLGRPWMTVACQGTGASIWYPCKDHQSDEPDEGASLSITVPDTLTAIANGRLVRKQPGDNHQMTYTWEVINPINNYNLIPYIGKYVHWSETYAGEKGPLDCTYWVLDYDLLRAREQFKQVPVMLRHFEYWLGPYPFYEDGYKLVQAPHLGMEHQSAVAYGNHFQNGYLGRDLSSSGWGNKWDFIIIHESGHEWFGNNLTTADLADMWVHEGFTNYLETLFTTREYGVEAGNDYVIGTRKLIRNNQPIIAPYGVNQEGSGDMYYKGGNLIHMIRTILNNDEQFRQLLRTMQQQWYHRITTSAEAEDYISRQTGINFAPVFDQYLRTVQIPQLQIRRTNDQAFIRWSDCLPGFEMSVKLQIGKDTIWVHPTTAWSPLPLNKEAPSIMVDRNFYVTFKTWTSTASD